MEQWGNLILYSETSRHLSPGYLLWASEAVADQERA